MSLVSYFFWNTVYINCIIIIIIIIIIKQVQHR